MQPDIWTILTAIASISSAVITGAGLLFVARQIRESGKTATADFVLRLESEFSDHYSTAYEKFLPGASWAHDGPGPTSASESADLERYLDFFANLQILRQQNLLDLDTIDKMFAYRFFIAANNVHTKKLVEPNAKYWEHLVVLYRDWHSLRKLKKQPIPNEAFPLVMT